MVGIVEWGCGFFVCQFAKVDIRLRPVVDEGIVGWGRGFLCGVLVGYWECGMWGGVDLGVIWW